MVLKKYEIINIANANAALNECKLFSYNVLRNHLILEPFLVEHKKICQHLSKQVANKEINQEALIQEIDKWSQEEVDVNLYVSSVQMNELESKQFDAVALATLSKYTIKIQ